MIKGYIYHLLDRGIVVYVGQTKSIEGIRNRIANHIASGKAFDSVTNYPVYSDDIKEIETNDIINLSPKYNKVISSSKRYTLKQTALDSIARAIKEKSKTHKLNKAIYYETKVVNKVLELITNMC